MFASYPVSWGQSNQPAGSREPLTARHTRYMHALRWVAKRPTLRSPLAVVALQGRSDSGQGASSALADFRAGSGELAAVVNGDEFVDYTDHRPHIHTVDGSRIIEWPDTKIHVTAAKSSDRDLVIVEGVEPHFRWRRYAYLLGEVLAELDVGMVITLSSSIADVPHTRPPTVVGSSSNTDLSAQLGLRADVEHGPATAVGTIHDELDARGIESVSLRVAVPHYVAGSNNPAASQALLERFERITGVQTDWADYRVDVEAWRADVSEAVNEDPDVVDYVAALEAAFDEAAASTAPDGEDLAADFQRFLRQQGH